jgi:hypothetical protein
MMNLLYRVKKLLQVAKDNPAVILQRGPTRGLTRSLKGKPWPEILRAVEAALDPADAEVVDQILRHVGEVGHIPSTAVVQRADGTWGNPLEEDGSPVLQTHGFTQWLWGLQEGWAWLPKRLPRVVLESWCGHEWGTFSGRRWWDPIVGVRCADCKMALPNWHAKTGSMNCGAWARCPVCGSDRIGFRTLSKPLGEEFRVPGDRPSSEFDRFCPAERDRRHHGHQQFADGGR